MSFGTALAFKDGVFALGPFLAMLFGSLLIQAATNMFNEFYDEQRGLDVEGTVGIAGSIVSGRVSSRSVIVGALFCYTLALFLGIYLISVGGWPILVLGCLSALGGYLYSAGPRPIAYTPASEVAVFLFMGILIVVIAYAVQAGSFPLYVPLAALPIGGLVAAILLANNIRDLVSDRRGGRQDPADSFRQGGGDTRLPRPPARGLRRRRGSYGLPSRPPGVRPRLPKRIRRLQALARHRGVLDAEAPRSHRQADGGAPPRLRGALHRWGPYRCLRTTGPTGRATWSRV